MQSLTLLVGQLVEMHAATLQAQAAQTSRASAAEPAPSSAAASAPQGDVPMGELDLVVKNVNEKSDSKLPPDLFAAMKV